MSNSVKNYVNEPKHYYRFLPGEGSPFGIEKGSIPHNQFSHDTKAFNSKGIETASFTIHVAPQGSRILGDDGAPAGISLFGHVFISVKTMTGDKTDTLSVGFSPGARYSTNKDNLSFNDVARYPDASTMTVEGVSHLAGLGVNALINRINDYKSGKEIPPDYNFATNNCVHFLKAILVDSGIRGFYLTTTPDGILGMLDIIADNYITPLIIDLGGDGVHTVGESNNVWFDFEGTGSKVKTGWAHPDDGFLVLDKNHDGLISIGEELFGENSSIHDGNRAKDGFEALTYFDINQDSIIDAKDSIWSSLQVWQDKNTDGISQKSELVLLDTLGITSISLSAKQLGTIDENSNIHHLVSIVQWASGKETDIVDVLLSQPPNFAPSNASTTVYDQEFFDKGVALIGQSTGINEISGDGVL